MISDQTIEMLDHPLSGTKIVVVGRRSEGRAAGQDRRLADRPRQRLHTDDQGRAAEPRMGLPAPGKRMKPDETYHCPYCAKEGRPSTDCWAADNTVLVPDSASGRWPYTGRGERMTCLNLTNGKSRPSLASVEPQLACFCRTIPGQFRDYQIHFVEHHFGGCGRAGHSLRHTKLPFLMAKSGSRVLPRRAQNRSLVGGKSN